MDGSAFLAGTSLMLAVWCASDWLRDRETLDAVFFWVGLISFVLNLAGAV